MRYISEELVYMWRHNKPVILIVVILSAVGLLSSLSQMLPAGDNLLANLHNNLFSPIFALVTLGIAFIVFVYENRQNWEASLPKRLTVNFVFNDRLVLRCEDAYLSGESDIRAWGQQLGSQMNDKKLLDFRPNILVSQSTNPVTSGTGKMKSYEATFVLTKAPESVLERPERKSAFDKGLSLIWSIENQFKDEWKRFEICKLDNGFPCFRPQL